MLGRRVRACYHELTFSLVSASCAHLLRNPGAGQVKGLEVGGVSAEEARALARPAMAFVREQLRGRLAREISRQYLRWLHPTSRRRPGESFL
jgi:hypothetical protein